MKILVIGSLGYLGNSLFHALKNDFVVHGCDIRWFTEDTTDYNFDYKSLKCLSTYSHILLFAGHSSVGMCLNNYSAAWENNVINFSKLIGKLNENQVLIYASSASVYGSNGLTYVEDYPLESSITDYDLTKQIREKITLGAKCKTIGLRLSTVNGRFSNIVRSELLLNGMVKNAIQNNQIVCTSKNHYRSVLGIYDLVRAVKEILNKKNVSSNIYNLASFSDTIGNFAEICSSVLNVPVTYYDDLTSKYSFQLNCDKFINEFNFKFNETPLTIINSIKNNYNNIIWTHRNTKKEYE